MNATTRDSYDSFLEQVATEASLLDASSQRGHGTEGLTYQAWSLALSEYARRTTTLADAWQAGATAMFQALVERRYIAPHEVERAVASTADVLTT
jgi:hypothetical protein